MPGPVNNSKLVNRPAPVVTPTPRRAKNAAQQKRIANAQTPLIDAAKLPPSLRAFGGERAPAAGEPGKAPPAPPTAPGKAPVKEPPKTPAKDPLKEPPPKAPPETAKAQSETAKQPQSLTKAIAPLAMTPAAPPKAALPAPAPAAAPPANASAAAKSAAPTPAASAPAARSAAPAATPASAPAPAAAGAAPAPAAPAATARATPTAAPASANEEGSEAAAETPTHTVAAGETARGDAAPAAAPAENVEAPGEAAPAPEAATDAPSAMGAAPGAAGPAAAPATDSMTRIARARPGAVQAEALVQAGLITQDSLVNEQAINRLADTRRAQVDALLATVQQSVMMFFLNLSMQVQTRILAYQALLMNGMMTILSLITQRILGTIATAQTWLNRAHRNLTNRITQISTTLQSGVSAITRRITGFVNSLPLPDLPGVERIRGIATSLLGGGARLVNRALANTTRGMLVLIGVGAGLLNNLLTGFSIVMTTLLGVVTRTIAQLTQAMFQAFNACMATVSMILMSLLQRTLTPLLARVGRIAHFWIGVLQQRALRSLRDTRQQAIDAIAESLNPPVAGPNDPPTSDAERIAMLRLLRYRALAQGMLIVRLVVLLGGEGIMMMINLVQIGAVRIITGIRSLIDGVLSTLTHIVGQVLSMLGSIVRYIHHAITLLSEFLQRAFVDQVEALARFLFSPVSNLVNFASNAARRLMSAASELVSRFIRAITGASVEDASTLVGAYAPAQIGPITPLRGPIVIPEPGTIERIIRVAAPLVVAAVRALVRVLGPKGAALVILLVLLIIAVLILYLLWLLLKWIYETFIKPKPKPTKRVIKVDPLRPELGVGGYDLDTAATLAPGTPPVPPLTWTVNPGGTPPVGVSVIGAGANVQLRSAHPPHNTVLGGTTFKVRAALTADPRDFADSAAITLIQILSANYTANPPLANVPSLIPGTFPPNTGEPNRDGLSGNTVVANVTAAPGPRGARIEFRTALDATASALTVTPGSQTGDLGLKIIDHTTGAELDPTLPSTAGGAAMMSDLTINAVPTSVASLTQGSPIGPYGVINAVGFASSDALHAPLQRVVGELITDGGDQLMLTPVNGGFNNTFLLSLAVPADQWNDQLWTPTGWPHRVDGMAAIDVNRFVGPGVPQLPRAVTYRQRFQYSAWHGAGTVISSTIADGQHIRSLIGTAPNFQFKTEHIFGSVAATPFVEPYGGNPLIVYSSPVISLDAPGATALANDGVSTGNLGVTTSVAGRTANWTVQSGDVTFLTANPITPPARSRVQAGTTAGPSVVRISDTVFPNRQLDVRLDVAAVALNNMVAADPVVPGSQMSTTVSLDAQPGGRTVDWSLDMISFARGVRVAPRSTGPGAPPMSATVTRPIGFSGLVTVIATDRVTSRTARCEIDFQ